MINYVPIELDSNLEQHTTPKFRYYTDEDQNKYYSVTTVLSILSYSKYSFLILLVDQLSSINCQIKTGNKKTVLGRTYDINRD